MLKFLLTPIAAVALSVAVAAPAEAQLIGNLSPQKVAQLKTKFMQDCPAKLGANAEGSKFSAAKLKSFCTCVWPHVLRIHREEAKDLAATRQPVGSAGEKIYIAERTCRAEVNMW